MEFTLQKLQFGWMPAHQTLFLKKEIYEKHGNYKTKLRYATDYEFILRILKEDKTKLVGIYRLLAKLYKKDTNKSEKSSVLSKMKEDYMALIESGYQKA